MNQSQLSIGVFDSGLGGLTVLKEIMRLLPDENTVYFGDTGRTPYGSKSPETVVKYASQIARFLQRHQIKLLVIACNTASARAYRAVCGMMQIPVIEVITPGAEAAVQASCHGRIGIIGTRGTIESGVYVKAIQQQADTAVQISQQACPLFVSLAEEGWWDHPVARQIADIYLAPLKQANIDTLVLGCTHYPLLKKTIAESAGPDVTLVDASARVADRVKQVLDEQQLRNKTCQPGKHTFFTSDSVDYFRQLGSLFLGRAIDHVGRVDIEQY